MKHSRKGHAGNEINVEASRTGDGTIAIVEARNKLKQSSPYNRP
jgi:putative NADH-flavin reductase